MTDSSIHKGKHLSKYLVNVPWYLLSSICTKLIGLLLLPIYTNNFLKEEIGALSTYESLGRIIVVFISLYLDAAFIRFYYKVNAENKNQLGLFFSTHFWFILIWGSIASLILIYSLPLLIPALPPSTKYLLPTLILNQLMFQLTTMVTSIWSANLKAKKISIYNITFSLFSLLITLYLILINKTGWESRIYALSGVYVMQLLFLTCIAIRLKWLTWDFEAQYIKDSLRYSIPLIPNIVAGWIAMFSDRLIMNYYGQLDQVGMYSIAAQLTLVLYVLNDSITRIQSPLAMSGLTDNPVSAKCEIAKFVLAYFSLITFCYCSILFVLPESIIFILGIDYVSTVDIFIILGWVYILSGIYRIFTNIISFHGATWLISVGAIFQAFINLGFNLILIPIYGMYAAALSTVISMIFYTLWIFLFSQKIDKVSLNYYNLFSVLLCALFVVFSLIIINNNNFLPITNLFFKTILFILMIIWFFNSQPSITKNYILNKLKNIRI